MAKKTKVDLGKGFKRIYYVIAGLWIAFMILSVIGDYNGCVVNPSVYNKLFCDDYSMISSIGRAIMMSAIVIPIYYFVKWIAAGFKK
tara:strand:- start:123 stop:383 length:261 start_codon:yes stop_codon:yes gene_type:complete